MDNKRMEIILSNILGELYTKTFDCDSEEFQLWLITEIGMTKEEMRALYDNDRFPVEV